MNKVRCRSHGGVGANCHKARWTADSCPHTMSWSNPWYNLWYSTVFAASLHYSSPVCSSQICSNIENLWSCSLCIMTSALEFLFDYVSCHHSSWRKVRIIFSGIVNFSLWASMVIGGHRQLGSFLFQRRVRLYSEDLSRCPSIYDSVP